MRGKRKAICIIVLCVCCMQPWLPAAANDAPLDVHLLTNNIKKLEDSYTYRVLKAALESQDRPFTLSADSVVASQLRRVETVRDSDKQYVIILGSSPDIEDRLQAVYVPVFLGLDLSRRIILTRKDLLPRLARVKDLDGLKEFSFGQGLGWADVAILENAGLKVVTPPSKRGVLRMMEAGRIDLFPRGLFEVIRDYESNKDWFHGLVIDDHLVLTYPLASFFFVSRKNQELHQALTEGLGALYTSGRLQDMLRNDPHHAKTLEQIRVDKRLEIKIPMLGATEATRESLARYPFIPGKPIGAPAR